MSIGPIPWNHIVDYGERAGLESDMLEAFCKVIRELDEIYLEDLRNKNQSTVR